jgi:hypothetical protein
MTKKLLLATAVALGSLLGCGQSIEQPATGSGGHAQTGGSSNGGSSGGMGGSLGQGGSSQVGGNGSGGSVVGGSSSAGAGGNTPAGGSANGGAVGKSGGSGAGGAITDGGSAGHGNGGETAKGGATGSTGGASGGTGGGTTVPPGASGLPAPGPGGVAKPAGTGSKVTVLDWAGYKNALSFTFDDSNSSQIANYSQLQAQNDKGNNARYTFYMQTGKTSELGNAVWPQAVKDGHELGNHTKSHSSNATTADIDSAETTLKTKFGVTAYSVAAPNGDSSYITVVPTMKEFLTNRTAGNGGGISATDDPSAHQWQLPCIIPATGASASAMQSAISSGTSGGKWNTFLVHGFSGGSDGAYQPVDIKEFVATVKWAKDQATLWIDTVENISSYWIAEYRFGKLVPTTSGSDKVWTWKTSDFNNPFPPGKYLRVKTDGATLAWDEHGYYEVSLDAGTLTLSP